MIFFIFIFLIIIYYIYREQKYKSLLLLNKESIFENVPLAVAKMNNGTMKKVNIKFLNHIITN